MRFLIPPYTLITSIAVYIAKLLLLCCFIYIHLFITVPLHCYIAILPYCYIIATLEFACFMLMRYCCPIIKYLRLYLFYQPALIPRPTLYYMMPMSVLCQIFQIKIKCTFSIFPGRRTLKKWRSLIFTRRQPQPKPQYWHLTIGNCEFRIVFIENNIGWVR